MKIHRNLLASTLALTVVTLPLVSIPSAGQARYEPYTFSTLAGLAGGFGQDDGAGNAARFREVTGLAIDSSDMLFVADTLNHTLRKITPAGVVTTLAGLPCVPGSADGIGNAARFNAPRGVAVDKAGNIYVADTGNHLIRKVTPAGQVLTLAGVAGVRGQTDGPGAQALFSEPSAVDVDQAGNVYVADTRNSTIRKITPDGVVTTLAGSAESLGSADGIGGEAQFLWPEGLTVDEGGNIFVADSANHTLRKVTPEGVVSTFAGMARIDGAVDGVGNAARFRGPAGLAMDKAGNLYMADDTIRKATQEAEVTTLAGFPYELGSADGTGIEARFNSATDVAVDSAGNIFVADSHNSTIRKVTPAGVVTTFAGLAPTDGNGDGLGSAARFYGPSAVALDRAGNVYVADAGNSSIRKVTAAGVVTTLAGTGRGSADGVGTAARFNHPAGVAVDSKGMIYVADTSNHTLRKVTPEGVVTTLAGLYRTDQWGNPLGGGQDGLGPDARFRFPTGLSVDRADNIYVADTYNNSIRKVTPEGLVTTLSITAGLCPFPGFPCPEPGFKQPHAVAVDSGGTLFVADTGNSSIRKLTPAGEVSTLAGANGQGGAADGVGNAARFNMPWGLVLDDAGNVYVADALNNTIRKVTPAGVVTTLAGLVNGPGGTDGTGSAARFGTPAGLVLDSVGTLYVADGNNTIRKGSAALAIFSSGPGFGWGEGQFGFATTRPGGGVVVVEASIDLVAWMPIWTNSLAADARATDPQSPAFPRRYYRARTP